MECLLLLVILLQFKIQSHFQKTETLNANTSELVSKKEKKTSKISHITFAILHFSQQNFDKLYCHLDYFEIYFFEVSLRLGPSAIFCAQPDLAGSGRLGSGIGREKCRQIFE